MFLIEWTPGCNPRRFGLCLGLANSDTIWIWESQCLKWEECYFRFCSCSFHPEFSWNFPAGWNLAFCLCIFQGKVERCRSMDSSCNGKYHHFSHRKYPCWLWVPKNRYFLSFCLRLCWTERLWVGPSNSFRLLLGWSARRLFLSGMSNRGQLFWRQSSEKYVMGFSWWSHSFWDKNYIVFRRCWAVWSFHWGVVFGIVERVPHKF